MMVEVWKPVDVEGYEDLYEVSGLGQVRSLDRFVVGRPGTTEYLKLGRILGIDKTKYGYCRVMLSREGMFKKFLLSRLVALHFIPNPYNLPEVDHINRDKSNNTVTNLEWVTKRQNCDRAIAAGAYKSKLTENDVRFIRNVRLEGKPLYPLAKKFGVDQRTIYSAAKGEWWKHVA